MPGYVEHADGPARTEEEIVARLRGEGLRPQVWANGPWDEYARHEHGYEKILYCVQGGIVFHSDTGDLQLSPGDLMVLSPHTPHAATVGPAGVRCVEATRKV